MSQCVSLCSNRNRIKIEDTANKLRDAFFLIVHIDCKAYTHTVARLSIVGNSFGNTSMNASSKRKVYTNDFYALPEQ